MFGDLVKGILGKDKENRSYRSMQSGNWSMNSSSGNFISFSDGTVIGGTEEKPTDSREKKKPVDIWESLLREDPVVDCRDLDSKIKTIKSRIKVLEDHVNGETKEEQEVLGYLEARKKYDKYKNLFGYPTTNDEMIDDLCQKYQVKRATLTQYSGTMPQEAINELHDYKMACKKIRKEIPDVLLIVPDTEEMKKKKRDPILLASSPFGRWYYILGAWDKEVLIVDEIIYDGK